MKIKINGKEYETKSTTLFSLKNECNKNSLNIIVILNGFQTDEDLKLNDGDEIFFIKKGEMVSEVELQSLMCARHTPKVYEKFKKAKVAIAGLGGLGSSIAVNLARTGIGNLHLIDFDIVEPSNLNRQAYKIKHLGLFKTEALKSEIAEINPYINVTYDTVKVNENNITSLFKDDDIICEAFDDPETKAMFVNKILEIFPEKQIICGSGMAGYESSNSIITKKISSNFYICGDNVTNAQVGRGLMAPRVAICAGHQSNMVLRLILGINEI